MKRIILLVTLIVAISGNLLAQDMPSKEEMQKACDAYKAPGEMHKMLAKMDGNWMVEVTMWKDPSSPPTKNKATCTDKMILGGLYQHSKHAGTMDGKPFEGYSITGYDNVKKMFQSTWVDNMGSGIMYMEGPWDATGKMIHYKGKGVDPISGKDIMVRQEYAMIDNNHQKIDMFMTMPGKPEMKSMEIMLTREMSSSSKKK